MARKNSCKECKRNFGIQGEYIIVPGKGKFCDNQCIKEYELKEPKVEE